MLRTRGGARSRARNSLRVVLTGALGLAVGGGLVATGAAVAADTNPFTLTMTSGSFQVNANPVDPLLKPTTITGDIDSVTGVITGGTFSAPPKTGTNQGATYALRYFSAQSGTGTGGVSSDGTVTYTDALTAEIHVTSPVDSMCTSTPINVVLKSKSAYDPAVGDIELEAKNSTIPNFHCTGGLAGAIEGPLNTQFSGSTNTISLNMHTNEVLPIPAPPANETSTVLTVSPDAPQLVGTAVTMTATVTSGDATATDAEGSVDFVANGTVLATKAVDAGVATFTTSDLQGMNNQLKAVYSGDLKYSGSTSPKVAYRLQPLPGISFNAPATVTPGNTLTGTLTLTNPAGGADWSNLFVSLGTVVPQGTSAPSGAGPAISYQAGDGSWCSQAYNSSSSYISVLLSRLGSATCDAPGSFALAAGQTLSVPIRLDYPAATQLGNRTLAVQLQTGTCDTTTTCTSAPGLSGTTGPKDTVTFAVVAPNGARYNPLLVLPGGPYTLARGISAAVPVFVRPDPASGVSAMNPTGTVTWAVNGEVYQTLPSGANATSAVPDTSARTGVAQLLTSKLTPGTYQVEVKYSGDSVYKPASGSFPVTITAAPPGDFYTCDYTATLTRVTYKVGAVVTAHATMPSVTTDGTLLPVEGGEVSITTGAGFTFSGTGAATMAVSPNPVGFALGSTPAVSSTFPNTSKVATWTNVSGSVVPSGEPGDQVKVAVNALDLKPTLAAMHCEPVDAAKPATFGTVTLAGARLSVDPAGPVSPGTLVKMSTDVSPVPANPGQVTFFDGDEEIGTATVNSTGTATISTAELAVGTHALRAVWNGGPVNASTETNTVELVVADPTTTTTISSSSSQVLSGPVTFTATVAGNPGNPGSPTGTVQFKSDGANLGSPVALTGGTATLTTSALTSGVHAVTAVYGGGGGFNASTSEPVKVLVGKATTVLTAADAATTTKGIILTVPSMKATLTGPVGPIAGKTITFKLGTGTPCTVKTDAQGVATCSASVSALQLLLGKTYTVSFAGDASATAATAKGALVS
ncbi:Ig-like domain repeat protein [Nocardioides marmoriginsengisoli]|uniref:Ig-like domain repeat protein n=1 Tax=Nocardioides marmoriginsengisoli TaxID=661483 RepID=A0A3N0CHI9_9ACTN|nr:Ig-like domain repeat protein [Nocardioides marmoriginsengisoli]